MTLYQQARWLGTLTGASIASYIMALAAMSQSLPLDGAQGPPPTTESIPAPQDSAVAPQGQPGEAQPLEQGPVHEAFAETIAVNPQGIVVDREPPAPVEEVPPEFRPEGENVEWIPGYWMWMETQNDFVWVSGVWRNMPPNRIWIPGTWVQEGSQFRWVPGYWSDAEVQQVNYLPYPPESLENGPSSPAPSEEHFWIPGCWTWRSNDYVWTPGYWYQGNPNWVWVPNHYTYTPRGAIFVNGYWDYPVYDRGLLYAPVYWPGGYRSGVVYSYRPSNILDTALLLGALFVDRDRGGYYYGWGWGGDRFVPWYSGYRYGNYYSPLFSYYNYRFGRFDRDWHRHVHRFDRHDWYDFARHRNDRDFWRRDWDRDRDRDRDRFDGDRRDRRDVGLIHSADDWRQLVRNDDDRRNRFRELSDEERERARERTRNWREFQRSRADFERESGRSLEEQIAESRRRGDRREGEGARGDRRQEIATFDLNQARGAEELRRAARERAQARRGDEGQRGQIGDFNRRDREGNRIESDSEFVRRGPGGADRSRDREQDRRGETQARRDQQQQQLRSYRGERGVEGRQQDRNLQAQDWQERQRQLQQRQQQQQLQQRRDFQQRQGDQLQNRNQQLQERQRNLEQQQRSQQERQRNIQQRQQGDQQRQQFDRQRQQQQQQQLQQRQQQLQRRQLDQQRDAQRQQFQQRAVQQQRQQEMQQRAYRGPDRSSLNRGSENRGRSSFQQQGQRSPSIQRSQPSQRVESRSARPSSRGEFRGSQGGGRSQSFSRGGGGGGRGESGNRGRGRGD